MRKVSEIKKLVVVVSLFVVGMIIFIVASCDKPENQKKQEQPSGGAGTFTITDYYSDKILRQVAVDEAKIMNGDQIRFYKEGVSIDIDLSMSALTEGSYTWCDRDCSGNFFYTQKGVTDELMWYAQKGVVELSKQDGVYTINVFVDAEEDYPENGVRIAISGTYIGYLATE
jgi:hypothetical protein